MSLRWCTLLLLLCMAPAAQDHQQQHLLRSSPNKASHRVEELERIACRYHASMCVDGLKFTDVYSSLFHARRNSVHNVVHIGIGKGEAVKIWHDYFPNANIFALANNAALSNGTFKMLLRSTSSRLKLHIGRNVSFAALLQESHIKIGSIDIIFESGCSGLRSCHEKVLALMFPFLRPGGHYIIEGVNLRSGDGAGFLDGPTALSAVTAEILATNHPFFVDASLGHKSLWKRFYNSSNSSSNNNNRVDSVISTNASIVIDFEDHIKHNLYLLVVRRRIGAAPPVRMQTGAAYLNRDKVLLAPVAVGNQTHTSIEDLAFKYGSHIGKDDHKYTDFYASLMQPVRHKLLAMAEVGVGAGQGLQLWWHYFSRATIYGLDDDKGAVAFVASKLPYLVANDSRNSSNRVVLLEADSTDGEAMRLLFSSLQRSLDLVIDDGCASLQCQERTLANLWGAVKPGGHYIVQNVQGTARGVVFAASPGALSAATVDILINNHAFLVDAAIAHRRWDWWSGVNKQTVGEHVRALHNSYLLVVRKRRYVYT